MKKRMIAMALLLCMALTLLTACGGGPITAEKAEKIVLKEVGMSAEEAHPHVHVGEYEGKPCFSVYITVGGVNWEYLVDSTTGDILTYRQSSHSH